MQKQEEFTASTLMTAPAGKLSSSPLVALNSYNVVASIRDQKQRSCTVTDKTFQLWTARQLYTADFTTGFHTVQASNQRQFCRRGATDVKWHSFKLTITATWRHPLNRKYVTHSDPLPQIHIIGAMVIVWRVRGKNIRSVLCSNVRNNCAQWNAHTYEQN